MAQKRVHKRRYPKPAASTSWDPLAQWYDGWVGEGGSEYHREVAIPAIMKLLEPKRGEHILDVGAGQGVLAARVVQAGAAYTGIDASPRLLDIARKRHGQHAQFLLGDARSLTAIRGVEKHHYDAATCLLSLQDMDPFEPVLDALTWALKEDGRVVILLTHPAFRVPRQSGWGWDEGRKLIFRRIDRYLTPLPVPMKPLPRSPEGLTTRSFHRPIHMYVNALADRGFLTERLEEIPAHKLQGQGRGKRAESTARREIPLFLGLRARRCEQRGP